MIIMFLLQMKQGLEGYGLLIYLRVSVAGQVLGITDFLLLLSCHYLFIYDLHRTNHSFFDGPDFFYWQVGLTWSYFLVW